MTLVQQVEFALLVSRAGPNFLSANTVEECLALKPEADEARAGVVWIACLPKSLDGADVEPWKAVSCGLTRPLARLDPILRELERTDNVKLGADSIESERPRLVITDRVVCVMPWPEHTENAALLQDLTSALAGKSLEDLEALARL